MCAIQWTKQRDSKRRNICIWKVNIVSNYIIMKCLNYIVFYFADQSFCLTSIIMENVCLHCSNIRNNANPCDFKTYYAIYTVELIIVKSYINICMYMVIQAIDLGNMEMSNQRINFAEFSACLMGHLFIFLSLSFSSALSLSLPLSFSLPFVHPHQL